MPSRAKKKKRLHSTSTSSAAALVAFSVESSSEKADNPGDFWQKAILFFFHLLFFTVPLFFTWVNQELFEFNKLELVYALTILIAACWIAKMITQKRVILRRTPFDIPIALFALSQVISTVASIHPHTSIFGYYTRFHGGLLSTISYIVLFYAFVSNVFSQQLKPFFITSFASSLLVTLMAIPEHFGHSFSCLMMNVTQALPVFGFQTFSPKNLAFFYDVSCWAQDVQNRVFSSFGQPNWLAAYAITLIPLGLSLSFPSSLPQKPSDRGADLKMSHLFFALVTILLFVTLLFTKSRSGIIGFVAGMSVFLLGVLVMWQKEKTPDWIKPVRSLAVSVVIMGSFALIYGTPYSPNLIDIWAKLQHHSVDKSVTKVNTSTPAPSSPPPQVVNNSVEFSPSQPQTTPQYELGGTDSITIRRIVWTGAIKVWERYPLFGSGVETFAYSYDKDRPLEHNLTTEWDFVYNKAHNEFLNFLATTGGFGFLSYCLMIGSFIIFPLLYFWSPESFYRLVQRLLPNVQTSSLPAPSLNQRLISLALASGGIALGISNFSGFSTVMVTVLLFLYPAFLVIFSHTSNEVTWLKNILKSPDEASVSSASPVFSLTQVVIFSLLSIITTYLLYSVYILWQADFLFTTGQRLDQNGQVGQGVPLIEEAIQLRPQEDYFYADLAYAYARFALALSAEQRATESAEFVDQSFKLTQRMVELNPVNPGCFSNQADILTSLAPLQPDLLLQAKAALLKEHQLAPTDPRPLYKLALIELQFHNRQTAQQYLEQSVQMRANYEAGRMSLGDLYFQEGKLDAAEQQYQYVLQYIQPNNQQARDALQKIATASATVKTKNSK